MVSGSKFCSNQGLAADNWNNFGCLRQKGIGDRKLGDCRAIGSREEQAEDRSLD